jgi:hypothetical protein
MKVPIIFFVFVQLVVSMPNYEEDQNNFNGDYYQDNNDYDAEFEDLQRNLGEENVDLFQGDIILSPVQEDLVFADPLYDDDVSERTGILRESMRWPKNAQGKVILPYVIQRTDYSKLKFMFSI